MTKALVTGAGGFIGTNLVRALLARGDEVHALVRPKSTYWRLEEVKEKIIFHEADLTSPEEMLAVVTEVQPEKVFHLAHYGGNRGENDARQIRATIIEGTAALYAACKEVGSATAIVHAGSSSEYGTKSVPMQESMVLEPTTEYGVAKAWATMYGEHMRREHAVPVTTLRIFSAYGPYEAGIRLFPAVTLRLLAGETPSLASPTTARDFVYVDDVVAAFVRASEANAPGVYNIGAGKSQTLQTAVEAIKAEIGADTELTWGADAGRSFDTARWVADTSRTSDVLGWSAQTSLEEGVRKTVDWFRTHKELYD